MSKAFTLTELLVSITIVFILIGLALSVGSRVQESSRTTRCATNIMQLSHALSLYISDYDSTYPVATHGAFKESNNGRPHGKGTSWYKFVFPYVTGQGQKDSIHCPSVNVTEILSSIDTEGTNLPGFSSGYAYNLNLSERIYDPAKRETDQSISQFDAKTENEIDYSSLVVAFAEARIGIIAIKKPDINSSRHQGALLFSTLKK